jgi:hypothetical protein
MWFLIARDLQKLSIRKNEVTVLGPNGNGKGQGERERRLQGDAIRAAGRKRWREDGFCRS